MSKIFSKPAILEQLGTTHCVIEASAGTGKTYLIEHLVLDLIIQGVSLSKILVVTFTTKATIELKTRIRSRLEKILTTMEDHKTTEPYSINDPVWEIDSATYVLIKEAMANFDKINISTIHGFCQQIIGDFAFESGQLFKQTVAHSDYAFNFVLKKIVQTRLTQVGAEQNFLVKTLKVMGGINGLSHLLQTAIKEQKNLELPDITTLNELLTNFPITAAEDCIKEIQNYQISSATTKRFWGPILTLLKTSNINSVSYKSIKNKLEKILLGIDAFKKNGMPGLFWSEVTPTDLGYLQEKFTKHAEGVNDTAVTSVFAIGNACNALLSNAYDFKAIIVETLLPQLVEELAIFKQKEGLVDFDDMILRVNSVINSHHGELLVKHLQERFQIAIIDEFQDTDSLQWEIFNKLFLNSKNHRLILVGDPKQAIYGFRGSDLQTYISAINTIKTITGKKAEELKTNFRSSPEIIEAQCKIFNGHNKYPFFTGRNKGLFKSAICGKATLSLQDSQGKIVPAIHIVEVNKKNALTTRRHIAEGIALAIKESLNAYKFEGNPIRPEQIMVLTSNAKEGLEMAHALKAVGVAHMFFRQDGLFVTPEANALLDLFLAIDEPDNIAKRAKVLLGPFFSFNLEEVAHCRNLPNNHPILTCLFNWQQLLLSGNYGKFFASIVSDSGITQRLLFFNKDERYLTNVLHLLELLQKETIVGYYTPFDLAIKIKRWMNGSEQPSIEDSGIQRLEQLSGAVQILTIHKAKGLEAPIVAIYGGFVESGKRAHIHRYHDKEGQRKIWIGSIKFAPTPVQELIDDERKEDYQRLLYVALTRAKNLLILPKIIFDTNDQCDDRNNSKVDDASFSVCNGSYQSVNQQLVALSNELDASSTITRHNNDGVPEQTTNNTFEQNAYYSTMSPTKILTPNFSVLKKACRPICKFSVVDTHNNLKLPSQQYVNNWQNSLNANSHELAMVIHQLLQVLPINQLAEQTITNWLEDPIVANLFETIVPASLHKAAATRTYRILTCKLHLHGGKEITLSRLERVIRNMDFIAPCPGQKDLLNGSLDMMLQWQGKTYGLDWKIDQLDSYCQSKLQVTVEKYYLLQARVCIIAICRFLDITSEKKFKEQFGGFIFAFIGGLPSKGMWILRPLWREVKNWELELEHRIKDNLT